MEIKLAENIRFFRKQMSMTQEQLAEVLGVTVGAVYKWEARLSSPELSLIMEMADFFDISVDVLLGYEMKDNCFFKNLNPSKNNAKLTPSQFGGLSNHPKKLEKPPFSW